MRLSRHVVLFSLITAISAPRLNAQVVIRDSVTITPSSGLEASGDALSGGSTLTFSLELAAPINPSPPQSSWMTIKNTACGIQERVFMGSSASVSVPARGGGTSYEARLKTFSFGSTTMSISIYLNGVLVQKDQWPVSCKDSCLITTQGSVGLFTSFRLYNWTLGYIPHGQQASLYAGDYRGTFCSEAVWHPNFPTELEIVEGAEYGELADWSGNHYGASTTLKIDKIREFFFLANGVQPTFDGGRVTIRASNNGVRSETSFNIIRLSCPALYAERTTASPGDTIDLLILERTPDGNEQPYPDGIRFNLGIERRAFHGLLRDVTLDSVASSFYLAPGPFQYIAPSTVDGDSVVGRIYADVIPPIFLRTSSSTGPAALTVGTDVAPAGENNPQDEPDFCSQTRISIVTYGSQCATVVVDSPVIPSGRAANIHLFKLQPDGSSQPFPEGQLFDIGIIEGRRAGVLVSADGDTGTVLYGVRLPLRFVAGIALGQKAGLVAVTAGGGARIFGPSGEGSEPPCQVTEIEVSGEILLGESRYYYTQRDPDEPDEWYITGSKSPPDQSPDLTASFTITALEGEKLGVYYERKKPLFSGGSFTGMADLPEGVIRIVGRYWEEGKNYSVILKAAVPGKGEKEGVISIVRPGRLGNRYRYARDVFDRVIDYDDTLITRAGKLGIPPQFLKAHIDQESAKKDFGDTVSVGFAPSYRFEPYITRISPTLQELRSKYYVDGNRSAGPMGLGLPPPDHAHVLFLDYPKAPLSIWDAVVNFSQLVRAENPAIYGLRRSDGFMSYWMYPKLDSVYWNEIVPYLLVVGGYRGTELAERSRNAMAEYLQFRHLARDGSHIWAQSRIRASYGPFQILYATALERSVGYPHDNTNLSADDRPERLNETFVGAEYSLRHLRILLDRSISKSKAQDSFWPGGLEVFYRDHVLSRWNSRPSYPFEVMSKVFSFEPRTQSLVNN